MGDRAVDPFDVTTRVNQAQVPRDALPTSAIEPVIVIEQAPAGDETANPAEPGVIVDPGVAADPVVGVEPELSAKLTRRMPELPDPALKVEDSARAPSVSVSFGAALTDRIARMRGVRPITKPPRDDDAGGRRGRGGFYAALVVSIASLVVSASVVMWARGEVRRARNAHSSPPPAAAELVADASSVAAAAAKTASSVAASATTATEAPAPPSCFVRVTSNIDDAVVWIDGERKGEVPAEVPVACGERATIEVRRSRFRDFRTAVVVAEGTVVIDARLERKRR